MNASQISYTITTDQTGAKLNIPSNIVSRPTSFNFTYNGNVIGTLIENDLDSSDSYTVR